MNQAIELLEKTGKALANAEKEYKKAYTKQYYVLKSLKEPASVILKIIYGDPEVAELREKRDIAEVEYKIAQEKLYALKNQNFISTKKTTEKENDDYYEKLADEQKQQKQNDFDILGDFDSMDFNFQVDEPKEQTPKIIEEFWKYQNKA